MAVPATPVKWGANEHKLHSTYKHDDVSLADNEQNLKPGTLLSVGTPGSLKRLVPWEAVVGVGKSEMITTASNTTYEKEQVLFRRAIKDDTYLFEVDNKVDGPFLTEADIHKYYDVTAEHTVDVASGTATAPTDPTLLILQLIKIFPGGREGEFLFTHA